MRFSHLAAGCALACGLGFLALPPASALAGPLAGTLASTPAGTPAGTAGPARTPISVSAPHAHYPYGTTVTLTVTLGPTVGDRHVALYVTPYGGKRELLATGQVNAKRKWYVPYRLTRAATFTAVFAGDARNAPGSASRTLDAHARVTDRIAGSSGTRTIGGVVYQVFHGNGTLTLHSTVAPDKRGECLEPETEQYDAGTGWDADTKYGCDKLNGQSHDSAPFTLAQAVGDRYRIRGDYLRGKDMSNLDAQGPWLYFTVTK